MEKFFDRVNHDVYNVAGGPKDRRQESAEAEKMADTVKELTKKLRGFAAYFRLAEVKGSLEESVGTKKTEGHKMASVETAPKPSQRTDAQGAG